MSDLYPDPIYVVIPTHRREGCDISLIEVYTNLGEAERYQSLALSDDPCAPKLYGWLKPTDVALITRHV
jgi:hypothetical protein